MPISYQVHADLGLFVTRYVGVVTNDEVNKVYRSILSDPELRHGFNALVDLQEVKKFEITVDSMWSVSALFVRFYEGRPESMRTAVLAPSDIAYGLGRMYGRYANPDPEKVTVFRDASKAMRWLGLNSLSLEELHERKSGTQ